MLIAVLNVYKWFSRLLLRLRGMTEQDRAARRIITGKSWAEFCDTLKAAGSAVIGMESPKDSLNQAEGYRYLSRLLRGGLEAFVEYSDPRAPVLSRMVHETVKMGADNPDNHYLNATISGQYEYLLRGNRGTVHFLGFSTQKGGYGKGGSMLPTGFLDSTELEVDSDGSFEVVVSCDRHPGNWLPMEPETNLILVRQTFQNRQSETPCDVRIERIEGDGLPSPVTAEVVDKGLRNASNLVAGASLLFAKWAKGFKKHTNSLPQMDPKISTRAGGDPKIAYYHGYWSIRAGEALVVEVMPPECEHWNFQLNNHWMESLDYRYYTVHINKHTASYREDGSVRIVVAHEDPGVGNWINTVGHSCGTMCLRWIKSSANPQPNTRIVNLQDLRREIEEAGQS